MLNRELFHRDPLDFTLPNDGVAKVGEPVSPADWDVLKFELQSFVCEGEYARGLSRILQSLLSNLSRPTQPAVWVSGFYGSGKSHLVRVLQFLWRDQALPDGSTARGLVSLGEEVVEQFKELSVRGRQAGGLWSAAGRLGGGAGDSIRLALLRIVFQAAGLPTGYPQARFVLWLKHEEIYHPLQSYLQEQGKTLERELSHLYVSPALAEGLIRASPGFAATPEAALQLLRAQFAKADEIGEEEFLATLDQVLELKSSLPGRRPLTLLVLDELEQYVSDNTEKMLRVQEVVEACSSRFGGGLLLVATGQSALQATAQLSKLKDRFTVRVELSSSDVETVIRQVALRKRPDRLPALEAVLSQTSGEIDRQLGGTTIAPNGADRAVLAADYPLLPARRRFWERMLRAIDRAGTAGQLRTQLRIVLEAAREVALQPVGTVVGGDFLYTQLREDMLKTGVLPQDVADGIEELRRTPEGELLSRLARLIFLIGKLPSQGMEDTGLRATAEALSDLLVRDLRAEGSAVRQKVPELLRQMAEAGVVMRVGAEYRLQSKASSEWEADFRSRLRGVENDEAQIASARQDELKKAISRKIGPLKVVHGDYREPRRVELFFGFEVPDPDSGVVPLWVRDGWQIGEKEARDGARELGLESPVVTIWIRRERADELKRLMAQYIAATQVLSTRPTPADRDGLEARAAMESRGQLLRRELDSIIEGLLEHALVLLGGGSEVVGPDLKTAVQKAADTAVERLFPEFKTADDPRWEKVLSRAKAGNPSALDELGYSGDADKHPVTQKVLAFMSRGPRPGSTARKHFATSPYGWPQDVVDAALYVLVASGHLRAEHQGQGLAARQIEQGKINQTQFRLEAAVVTLPQRLAVRRLLSELGIPYRNDDEPSGCVGLVETLRALAQQAGGPPPCPEAPSPPYLAELATLRGNELLLAVANQQERLAADFKQWQEVRQQIEERLPRWASLERLLSHGAALSELAPLANQKAALLAQRGLLQTPDPVPPLIEQAAGLLREKIRTLYQQYQSAFEQGMARLQAHPAWQPLASAEAGRILEAQNLRPLPEPRLGNAQEVQSALETLNLQQLQDRLAALPTRFSEALQEALRLAAPKAIRLSLPSASLQTEEEVDEYLQKLRQAIMQHIAEGSSVIL